MLGFVVGEDAEAAEQRFFAEWTNANAEQPANTAPAPAPQIPRSRCAAGPPRRPT